VKTVDRGADQVAQAYKGILSDIECYFGVRVTEQSAFRHELARHLAAVWTAGFIHGLESDGEE
jgi:hypothetical protein